MICKPKQSIAIFIPKARKTRRVGGGSKNSRCYSTIKSRLHKKHQDLTLDMSYLLDCCIYYNRRTVSKSESEAQDKQVETTCPRSLHIEGSSGSN